jgi:hypothetical protein
VRETRATCPILSSFWYILFNGKVNGGNYFFSSLVVSSWAILSLVILCFRFFSRKDELKLTLAIWDVEA